MSRKTGTLQSGKANSLQLVELGKDLCDLAACVCRAAESPIPSEPFYVYIRICMHIIIYSSMYRKLCMCFHFLSCPAAAIVFPNCDFWHFPFVACFSSNPLRPPAFSDTFLSEVCCARPFSDSHGMAGEQVETLCLISQARMYLSREPKLSAGKSCPCNPLSCMDSPGCAVLSAAYVPNRRTYSTCNIFWEAWLFQAACGSENSFI